MKFLKLAKSIKEEVRQAVLLLRFRTTEPKAKTAKYMSYARISKAVGQPYNVI